MSARHLLAAAALAATGCATGGIAQFRRICSPETLRRGEHACLEEASLRPERFVRVDHRTEPAQTAPVIAASAAWHAQHAAWKVAMVRTEAECREGCQATAAALERALVARGIQLTSPNAALRPHFVVVVRRAATVPGAAIREDFGYFTADSSGESKGPVELTQSERRDIRDFVHERTDADAAASEVLDVQVLTGDSGEVAWTYEGHQPASAATLTHYLFGERGGAFWPVVPASRSLGPDGGDVAPTASETMTHERASRRASLVQRAAEDVVEQLLERPAALAQGGK